MMHASTLQAGVAQMDITAPLGIDLTGYVARAGAANGVHDPLHAKALVFDNGTTSVALLTVDILGLQHATVQAVRTAIAAATDIPADHVMIACSHSHSGPATMTLHGCGVVDAAYLAHLQTQLCAVAVEAWAARQPAHIGIGQGQVQEGVHNRRTAGDLIDPALGILRVDDTKGNLLGVLLNYTCHPTCVTGENTLLSAEYCGLAAAQIQAETGAVVLWTTGAIGDVGPVRRGWDVLTALGETVRAEALRVLPTIATTLCTRLASATQPVLLPFSPLPSAEELTIFLDAQQAILADPEQLQRPYQDRIAGAMIDWATATLAQVTAPNASTTVTTELQVLRIGDLALVSAPGELFVELGLAIKAGAADGHCFVCGFGNDNIGYIPARRAYPHGGYEIADAYKYYGYPAVLAPEAGELLVATALGLLKG
ncbi:MAG TPA: neutral/alkaline non-lysosomal ceramidase N-terminal domain-containing protein [Caldilineaceae bacterium]|nr:neutral/alkaline non-lysosomal ceramidase N-terminal domain-containing protein [Caldilineaceae bacterium]